MIFHLQYRKFRLVSYMKQPRNCSLLFPRSLLEAISYEKLNTWDGDVIRCCPSAVGKNIVCTKTLVYKIKQCGGEAHVIGSTSLVLLSNLYRLSYPL